MEFLPPRAPDANEPGRWEARPQDGDGHARMVVATKPGAAPVVQAGEHPPRNTQAIVSLGVGLAGVALLVLSVGISFLVSLPCAIIAVVVGRQGRRRAQGEGIGGARAARAGVVVGWIGIALCVLAAIVWIVLIVADVDIGTDFGRDAPSAPTDLSVIGSLLRGHL
jgi:hypothetical protein